MDKKNATTRNTVFVQGYVCAVAEIIRMYDEPTIAKNILDNIGEVDWQSIDEYDRKTLAEAGLYKPPGSVDAD